MAESVRWLSQEQLAAWLRLSAVMVTLPYELDAQLQRDSGINQFEYHVLAMLSEAPGRSRRMSEVAVLTNGSLSRLSHVVSRLERRGWVQRQPCPEDGRYTNAVLTDDGFAALVAAAPGHVENVRRLVVDVLTDEELGQLRAISSKILGQEPSCSGGVETGPPDAGPTDRGPVDAGPVDAGPVDAGPVDRQSSST